MSKVDQNNINFKILPIGIQPDKDRLANIKLLQEQHQQLLKQKLQQEPIPFSAVTGFSIKRPPFKPLKIQVEIIESKQEYNKLYQHLYYKKNKRRKQLLSKLNYQKNKDRIIKKASERQKENLKNPEYVKQKTEWRRNYYKKHRIKLRRKQNLAYHKKKALDFLNQIDYNTTNGD